MIPPLTRDCEIKPRLSRDRAEIEPRLSRDRAEIEPRSGRDRVEIGSRSGRDRAGAWEMPLSAGDRDLGGRSRSRWEIAISADLGASWKMSQSAMYAERSQEARKYGTHEGNFLPIHGTCQIRKVWAPAVLGRCGGTVLLLLWARRTVKARRYIG